MDVELPTAVAELTDNDAFRFQFSAGILQLDSSLSTPSDVQLYNQLGQPVFRASLQQRLQCDISPIAPGVYILKISGNHPTYIQRFVKS